MLLAMVNLDKWNALPKHYQNVLEQAGHYANNWMMAKYDAVNPMALRKLLAGGAKLHAFSPPIMEASFKAAKELHSEVAATNANFKKVYEFDDGVLEQWLPMVPGRRTRLRHLHGAPRSGLIASAQMEKPRSRCSGVLRFPATRIATVLPEDRNPAAGLRFAEPRS